MWVLGAFILGTLGLLMWYMRMFCDNPTAELWRSVGLGFRLEDPWTGGRSELHCSVVSCNLDGNLTDGPREMR